MHSININFTTAIPGDFVAIVEWCRENGLSFSASGKAPSVASDETAESSEKMGAQLGPWRNSPAVRAFYAVGLEKLRRKAGETYHMTALRRLSEAGKSIAGIATEWEPSLDEIPAMEGTAPSSPDNLDEEDI